MELKILDENKMNHCKWSLHIMGPVANEAPLTPGCLGVAPNNRAIYKGHFLFYENGPLNFVLLSSLNCHCHDTISGWIFRKPGTLIKTLVLF